jgi:hypothetical protein
MLRRLLPIVVAAATVALVVPAGDALAHDHAITATCTGVSVLTSNYTDAQNPNTIDIWVDGSHVVSTTFGTAFSWSTMFDDSAIDHSYRVAVVSPTYTAGAFDTGLQTIERCATEPTGVPASTAPSTTDSTSTTMPAVVAPPPPLAPTTTGVGSGGPAPTAMSTSPASVGALPVPGAPATTAASAGVGGADSLPATGRDGRPLSVVAVAAVLAGAALVGAARRREGRSS